MPNGPHKFYGYLDIKLSDNLCLPNRAHPTDAGLDLKSREDWIIYPGEMKVVKTGVSVKIPEYYVGLVFSRSGMGKVRVTLSNSVGVIDAHYRGEIMVMIENNGYDPFIIKKYDRIAQLVITPVITPQVVVYDGTEEDWNDTQRGSSGFGSTGKQ